MAFALSSVLEVSATPSCASPPEPLQCCVPSQVLFLMDRSLSIDPAVHTLTEQLDLIKRLRCLYKDGQTQFGLITFNNQVVVSIPLATYSSSDWYSAVDTAAPTISPQQPWTPVAEALELALNTFNANPPNSNCSASVNRVVVLLTDGYPSQNTVINTGVTSKWLANAQTHGVYQHTTVPNQAQALRDIGTRIIAVLVNNADKLPTRELYLTGVRDNDYRCGVDILAYKTGACNPPTVSGTNSQCFRTRTPSTGPTPSRYQGFSTTPTPTPTPTNLRPNYPTCYGSGFQPIADYVVKIADNQLVSDAVAGAGPFACPFNPADTCFA